MRIELPEDVTIARAEALRALLLEAIGRGEELVVGAGAVASVDAAGLQVLCAAARSAAALGVRLALDARSDALAAAVARCGLERAPGGCWLAAEGRDA
ncbi:STAS domain-containing protein [Anaeromyxobacter dehalogenans]|uniref:Anti-sigma-factor antagonist (STAS) domain protein n=1 Tax=Anaeromyxobacter dehalogenans (strain 2CP-C) TaxID=290397 RepID=Q2IQR5_ANADE|nr:STAS domain-containing protein [Anaeromyxobacter dehalogenans]ABC81151.1 anti-sigma-factor antagonist (STAS) domain protein [Anaeromyxobacter dehalogenans 2CP-C]